MEYELSDSSGTDDDLPPPHQNRFARGGRVAGNGRSAILGPPPFPRMQNDMETEIHVIEQEAYCTVLRAFKAQSDAITWEKEDLITALRKELRVSDEEHRELLSRVHADDVILRIREWRKTNGLQPGMIGSSQPLQDNVPSPTVSASRKKPKPSQSAASLSVGAPSPALHPSVQPSSSALKRGLPPGSRGKKTKPYPSAAIPGPPQATNRSTLGAYPSREAAERRSKDPLIGRTVWTRWPDDNNFYEAKVHDYDPIEGRHALVYDKGTTKEAWEWVNLNEISPEDIRWDGEDPGISNRGGRGGTGRGFKKSMARAGSTIGAGRGRGSSKGQSKKDVFLSQNGIGRKASGDIELYHTDTLIKEVEKIFGASPPDPAEVEKAKKALREHEQALIDAIARLEDASDGESDGGDHPLMDQEREWRKRSLDEMGGEGSRGIERQEGDKTVREGRITSEKRQDAD
ncbi:Protein EMSY-LIKE 3 [Dionaea muscipula]